MPVLFKFWRATAVLDVGCGEGEFLRRLRHCEWARLGVGIDKHGGVLRTCANAVSPMACDYLRNRTSPLRVALASGCFLEHHRALTGFDAVVCVEVIEHLQKYELPRFAQTIFQLLRPKIVVITTPNSECNTDLGVPHNTFRHPDHKFEWSRTEFSTWCTQSATKFGYNSLSFTGAGREYPQNGHPSQIAVFSQPTVHTPSTTCVPLWLGAELCEQSNVNGLACVVCVDYPMCVVEMGCQQNSAVYLLWQQYIHLLHEGFDTIGWLCSGSDRALCASCRRNVYLFDLIPLSKLLAGVDLACGPNAQMGGGETPLLQQAKSCSCGAQQQQKHSEKEQQAQLAPFWWLLADSDWVCMCVGPTSEFCLGRDHGSSSEERD